MADEEVAETPPRHALYFALVECLELCPTVSVLLSC